MIIETITLVLFANLLGFFILYMTGCEKNVESRTERELQIIEEENKQ